MHFVSLSQLPQKHAEIDAVRLVLVGSEGRLLRTADLGKRRRLALQPAFSAALTFSLVSFPSEAGLRMPLHRLSGPVGPLLVPFLPEAGVLFSRVSCTNGPWGGGVELVLRRDSPGPGK